MARWAMGGRRPRHGHGDVVPRTALLIATRQIGRDCPTSFEPLAGRGDIPPALIWRSFRQATSAPHLAKKIDGHTRIVGRKCRRPDDRSRGASRPREPSLLADILVHARASLGEDLHAEVKLTTVRRRAHALHFARACPSGPARARLCCPLRQRDRHLRAAHPQIGTNASASETRQP